jgi:hypothetical protein
VDEEARRKNTTKSRVRAKIEHPFRILKHIFGFDKVRYRGINKNHHRLCVCFALINLYLHRKRLTLPRGVVSAEAGYGFRRQQSSPNSARFQSISLKNSQRISISAPLSSNQTPAQRFPRMETRIPRKPRNISDFLRRLFRHLRMAFGLH